MCTLAPTFVACCYNGQRCPHDGRNSKAHGLRWGQCGVCNWEGGDEKTCKWHTASGSYVCLLCWPEKMRLKWGDVCLCKDTIDMLARIRMAQLRMDNKEDRVVPEGTPDALRSILGGNSALADFLHIGARPPVAPVAFPVPSWHCWCGPLRRARLPSPPTPPQCTLPMQET